METFEIRILLDNLFIDISPCYCTVLHYVRLCLFVKLLSSLATFATSTVKKTIPCLSGGSKMAQYSGGRYWGFYSTPRKRGKEWRHSIRGIRYSGGRYWKGFTVFKYLLFIQYLCMYIKAAFYHLSDDVTYFNEYSHLR